jgi:3,4-dihydroxy 2-butanone 4-phosphate synthase / GTP cyclohydrolase II
MADDVGTQILKKHGLSNIRLLTNNLKKTDVFIYGGFDLEVIDQMPIHERNAKYIVSLSRCCRSRMAGSRSRT